MGIVGLYQELGPGSRVSLAKLSADHYICTGRRLRLAVDASIWAFQVQAGKGGNNPALRTLYYRLIRLLHLNITPLFVFDGPNRPVFKRNHKTNTTMTPTLTRSTKALLKLFGFPYHEAPGEAEAECANLQKHGIVDAVLSEDVDTLMFGCEVTFRNWSGEGGKSKTPTHVSVYEREDVGAASGLTPEGMVLIALMRGGDYLPEGVPKCGVRIAADAARAGFGELLCALDVQDEEGLATWRRRLQRELETNESGYFKRKNKTVRIPDGFPDMTVLGYYKKPIVSSKEKVERLQNSICWSGEINFSGLRESARWAFEWRGKIGAAKFIRCLAPAVMSWNLCTPVGDVRGLVSGFHGRREHFSTGECRELRISFIPGNVVKVNMDAEADDDVEVQPDDDDEFVQDGEDGTRKGKDYDPYTLERMWVLEVFARQSVPEMVEEYENQKPKAKKTTTSTTKKPRSTKSKDKSVEAIDTMLGYSTISKPRTQQPTLSKYLLQGPLPSSSPTRRTQREASVDLSSLTSHLSALQILEDDASTHSAPSPILASTPGRNPSRQPLTSNPSTQNHYPPPREQETSQEQENIWNAPAWPCETVGLSPPRGRRYSALGIYGAVVSPQAVSPTVAGTTVSIPSSPEAGIAGRSRVDRRRGSTEKKKNTSKGKAPVYILDISDSESGGEASDRRTSPPLSLSGSKAEGRTAVSGRTTKKAVLRSSIEGSWEFADGKALASSGGGWVDVEVLDLTGA
ncbi:flap structure-specific endonuclease [Tuber brumale]|nr:flap structure-specific endonuclease [Tuber brumale]